MINISIGKTIGWKSRRQTVVKLEGDEGDCLVGDKWRVYYYMPRAMYARPGLGSTLMHGTCRMVDAGVHLATHRVLKLGFIFVLFRLVLGGLQSKQKWQMLAVSGGHWGIVFSFTKQGERWNAFGTSHQTLIISTWTARYGIANNSIRKAHQYTIHLSMPSVFRRQEPNTDRQ